MGFRAHRRVLPLHVLDLVAGPDLVRDHCVLDRLDDGQAANAQFALDVLDTGDAVLIALLPDQCGERTTIRDDVAL
jgi:hypothetical protein